MGINFKGKASKSLRAFDVNSDIDLCSALTACRQAGVSISLVLIEEIKYG